ncbi:hypothetical protein MLD38_010252 [Melastoma candidum]|uniref:Uncharacterized protein n=1 Tax=Melastoma candidum TaxID=119954 RepID=A0ACB9QZ88_9MYRT|nr:hypothetical protein MLD38_010252 [Melastoma candidum]
MAVSLSRFQGLDLDKDMLYSIFRAFLQLSVISFVLDFIFHQANGFWMLLAYLFMVCIVGHTAVREACPPGKVNSWDCDPYGDSRDDYSAPVAQGLPLLSTVHHPRRRDDGRELYDSHRGHHEEAPGRHKGADKPGRDGVGHGG